MLLDKRTAIIYGAGGPIGSAVARAYAREGADVHLAGRAGHGVILGMAGGREAIPRLGGSHVAWAALAGLCRQLAAEFGPHGVRVTWLLSPGSPSSDEQHHDDTSTGGDEATPAPGTAGLLRHHQPSYDEVAN